MFPIPDGSWLSSPSVLRRLPGFSWLIVRFVHSLSVCRISSCQQHPISGRRAPHSALCTALISKMDSPSETSHRNTPVAQRGRCSRTYIGFTILAAKKHSTCVQSIPFQGTVTQKSIQLVPAGIRSVLCRHDPQSCLCVHHTVDRLLDLHRGRKSDQNETSGGHRHADQPHGPDFRHHRWSWCCTLHRHLSVVVILSHR